MRIYVYFLLECTNRTTLLASYSILQCTLVASLHSTGASQVVLMVKNLPADAGDTRDVGCIPGLGRSPGERKGDPLQYSCLENSLDRGAQQAIVHGVAESWTQLSDFTSLQGRMLKWFAIPLSVGPYFFFF